MRAAIREALEKRRMEVMPVSHSAFACDEPGCTREFTTEMALRFHKMRTHLGKGVQLKDKATMKCPQCGMPQNERSLPKHMRTVHHVYVKGPRTPNKKVSVILANNKPKARTLGDAVAERTPAHKSYHPNRKRGDMTPSEWGKMRIPCPECQKEYSRSSLSQHLRATHGIYRTKPRDPKNNGLVKSIISRQELNVQRLGRTTSPVLEAHFIDLNGKQSEGHDPHQHLAIRVQALIQIAELIAKL